jgi:hypothetical protein
MPPGDFAGYVAQIQYVRDALLEHGRVPLWCAECYGGTTNFTGHGKEYLAFPLATWLGPLAATKAAFAILKALAALGLYAVVARLFAAPLAGLVAGYAYGFGAVANHQSEHLDVAVASALVPAIFLASVELLRRERIGWAVTLGALAACQLTNNWVHAAPVPLAVLLLAFFRPWREQRAEASPSRGRRIAPRQLLLLAGALGVFVALAGSQLAWIASDARNHRLIPAEQLPALREIYIERSPFLFVNRANVLGPWLERHHPPGLDVAVWDAGRRYLGIVALAVSAAGWLAMRRNGRLRRWARVAGLVLLVQYWLSLGARTLLWEVATSLHWADETQRLVRIGLQGASLVALLVAASVALRRRSRRRDERAPSARAGPLLGAALLLFFPTFSLWNLCAQVLPPLAVQRSPGHFFDTAPFWVYLLFALALVALGRRMRRPVVARAALVGVALAVAIDFWPSRASFSHGVPMQPLRRARAMVEDLSGDGGTLRIALAPSYSPIASWLAAQAPPGHAWGWLGWQAGRHWPPFIRAAAWNVGAYPEANRRLLLQPNGPLLAAGRIRYFLHDAVADGPIEPPPPWRRLRTGPRFAVWEQPDVLPNAMVYRARRASATRPPSPPARSRTTRS